ncbi:efflux RND transporter periplasmic adaptor subunit [Sporomusa sp. KB1]|jgi:RND family efflux transporter MFP subunit|uniref:efflux RND transporter periplasmic adaptor subunit n=1 Tax=Sporomusa sp. KB1 TaxID=943346 RepID=UPI0011AC5901|nr:efflux RND transporter periplasmic adaptor subunit [Sporomusa sp. KB1]TWH51591.1 RND family efflux transporter MFP subunit [Sporomusa sp. KB1]TWH52169.1 RND family efflux transporter MFP subunit [Sporomusa sp. KB1]
MNKISVPAKYIPPLVITVLLIAGLLGVRYFGLFSFGHVVPQQQGPVTVTTAPVSIINKEAAIILPGSVQSRQAVIISAEISGHLSEVTVAEGQQVQAGQLLAHIEGSAASAGIETAANPIPSSQNEGSRQQAQANYDNIAKEYDRYQKLYQVGGIARRQFEDVSARLQAAREALSSTQDTQDTASSSSSTRLPGSVNLTAPISGKVTGLAAANGKTVQTGQQLMVLDTGGDVRVVVHLEQKDLYLVSSGTLAEIVVNDSVPQSLTGQVEAIYPVVGTDTPSFLAHIRVDNTNGLLKAELPVQVHLKTGNSVPVRAVPLSAVFQDQELNYLYLAIDGKAVRQQVDVGATINDFVEITSSLPEQARIITSGINNLKDGDAVALP